MIEYVLTITRSDNDLNKLKNIVPTIRYFGVAANINVALKSVEAKGTKLKLSSLIASNTEAMFGSDDWEVELTKLKNS